jgi:hypothetical protein
MHPSLLLHGARGSRSGTVAIADRFHACSELAAPIKMQISFQPEFGAFANTQCTATCLVKLSAPAVTERLPVRTSKALHAAAGLCASPDHRSA